MTPAYALLPITGRQIAPSLPAHSGLSIRVLISLSLTLVRINNKRRFQVVASTAKYLRRQRLDDRRALTSSLHLPLRLHQTLIAALSVTLVLFTQMSCHGIDPAELEFTRHPPIKADLIGAWTPTPSSIKEMRERGKYEISRHELNLHADGSFSMTNMPDWWQDPRGESGRGFKSGLGTWGIYNDHGDWVVTLDFADHFRAMVHLRHQKPPYLMHVMLGDPDTGHAMLLEKVQ